MQDQVSDNCISKQTFFTSPKALLPVLSCSLSALDGALSWNPNVSKKSLSLYICRFRCIFFLFYLGPCWNPVFCCKLSQQQQQQLWRIWWWHRVTDQTEPGPEPQWKSCTWQARSLGTVPHDPKWTKSEVFDLLGFCGKHCIDNTMGTPGTNSSVVSFLCKCISLGDLKQHKTGLRILPLGRPMVKMNASVLPAMALTCPSLKRKAPLPFYPSIPIAPASHSPDVLGFSHVITTWW